MIAKFESTLPPGRQRYLALGRYYADAVNQIRERGLEAALELVATMGGATQRKSIARGLVKLVDEIGAVPPHRVVEHPRRRWQDGAPVVDRVVVIPGMTWKFRGRKQIAAFEWVPMFSATDRQGAPVFRHPLPV